MAKKSIKESKETRDAALSVLVGTFRKENAEWIKEKKLYNLPLPPCGKVAFHENISRVVLIAEGFKSVAYEAKFSEVVDATWLKENGYKVAAADKAHGSAYALYELGEELSFAATLSNPAADVFVSSKRCPNVKIDKEFYQKPYPKTGGKSMPHIFDKLKRYFTKWHSATTFNPVQLDFFSGLLGEDKSVPFPGVENPRFTFIDLFAGVGGIRLGFQKVGGNCIFSSEWNSAAAETYERNFGEKPQGDIQKINERSVPDHDILCAGFPCQPFSISGKQKGFDDIRGTMFFELCRIVKEKKPKVVFLENVKHLVHHDKGRTLRVILETLSKLGYCVSWKVLNGVNFGVPQNRERIIIVGSKDKEFNFSTIETKPRERLIDWLDKDGLFEYLKSSEYTLLDNPKQQEESGLIFAGYRNKSIRKVGVRPGTLHLSRVHKQPNRIYSVMGIHPTLPSQESSGRYFIRLQNDTVRKLTLNECWRIMGFPEKYIKISVPGEQYKQLGNSVCIPMIEAVAKEIKNQFFGG